MTRYAPQISARGSLRVGQLTVLLLMSHAPILVLWVLIPSTFQYSGVAATPIVYVLGGLSLVCAATAFSGMARRMQHPGGVYAMVAVGLGPASGLAVAAVTVVAYIGLLACLLAGCGQMLTLLLGTLLGTQLPDVPVVVLLSVALALTGQARLRQIVSALSVLLGLQIVAMAVFVGLVLRVPAGGSVSWAGFDPEWLLTGSLGVALCFVLVGYMGIEVGLNFGPEVRNAGRTLPRATYAAIGLMTVLMAVSAWAVSVGVGPGVVSGQPQLGGRSLDAGQPLLLAVLVQALGPGAADGIIIVASLVLLSCGLGSSVVLQQTLSRLFAGLARDQVIPGRFKSPSDGRSAGTTSSWLIPTVSGLVALGLAVGNSAYSLWIMLSSGLAISGTLTVLSVAVVIWFLRTAEEESGFFGWEGRVVAGFVSIIINGYVFTIGLLRLPSLVPGNVAVSSWMLPTILVVVVIVGLCLAAAVRVGNYAAYRRIGQPMTTAEADSIVGATV